jgi:hypothetical protein
MAKHISECDGNKEGEEDRADRRYLGAMSVEVECEEAYGNM